MEVSLSVPNDNDIISVYECYRLDGEPDSPKQPFDELPHNEQQKWINSLHRMVSMIILDGVIVGWISIIPEAELETNLGFGLFKEFRGKRLMSRILPTLLSQIYCKLPNHRLTSGAQCCNLSAIRTLEKAGFQYIEIIKKFEHEYLKFIAPQ